MAVTPALANIDVPVNAVAPDIAQLTTMSIDGTGVFDKLMKATTLHLTAEYEAGRITGKEYATVYVGSVQSVLQRSLEFLLNDQQVAKINAEIGLIRQQIATELANTDDAIPAGLAFNDSTAIQGMMAAKLLTEAAQAAVLDEEALKMEADKDLVGQKIVTELAQTDTDIPVSFKYGFNNGVTVDGFMKSQTDKADMEIRLTEQKLVTELVQTEGTIPVDLGEGNGGAVEGFMEQQILKGVAEVQLLNQKTATELAQTSDTIPAGTALNPNTGVESIVLAQKNLFVKQTDGFDRDAEQKLTKMLLDTWSVRRTTDEATTVDANGLDDAEIKKVVDKAKDGIGVAVSPDEFRLYFDAGTSAFGIGNTVTGGTSTDTGAILGVVVTSGAWATNDAVGYLVLTTVSAGDFQDDETITDDGGTPGSATTNGVVVIA